MRRLACFFLSLICMPVVLGARKASDRILVASYSSFADSWGKGRQIAERFEAETGIEVELLDLGSGFEFIKALESEELKADVAVGVDDSHLSDFDGKYEHAKEFDYGYYAFVIDTRWAITPPLSMLDLANPEYKGKIILIDPRTSFVGFGLLRWAVAAFGQDDGFDWLNSVMSNALVVAPSWTVAYSLFTKGEAPIVLSYSTSPAYHYEHGEDYVESLVFPEGNLQTREFAFAFSDSSNLESAERFVDFLVKNSEDIAVSNVMYPSGGDGLLPESYSRIRKPLKVLHLDDRGDELILKWLETAV